MQQKRYDAVAVELTALLVICLAIAGCTQAPSGLSTESRPRSSAATSTPLDSDQQRVTLNGLQVTLTATSTVPAEVKRLMTQPLGLPLKKGFRPLYVELTALNTTDSTLTIGPESLPSISDSNGRIVADELGYAIDILSMSGPYWGHGGPPPGRPQNSDFAPGGSLTVRLPRQVPESSHGFSVTWELDDDRVANFTIE